MRTHPLPLYTIHLRCVEVFEKVTMHDVVRSLIAPCPQSVREFVGGSRVVLDEKLVPVIIITPNVRSLLVGEGRLPTRNYLIRHPGLGFRSTHVF